VSLKPKLYRDIEIPSDNMLADLARSIIRSFGFDFDHPYGFYSLLKGNILRSPVKYELFADMDDIGEPSDAGSVERTRIGDVFRRTGGKMTFLFDYGDNWEFLVELIGQKGKEHGAKYPRVIAKVGKAPEQYPRAEEEQ
jgi:hypothetical protein